jgi:hypothetical protein
MAEASWTMASISPEKLMVVERHPAAIGEVLHAAEVRLGRHQDGQVELPPQELGHRGLPEQGGPAGEVLHVGEEVRQREAGGGLEERPGTRAEPVEPSGLVFPLGAALGLPAGAEGQRPGGPGGEPLQRQVGAEGRRGQRVLGAGRLARQAEGGPGLPGSPALQRPDRPHHQRAGLSVRHRARELPAERLPWRGVGGSGRQHARRPQQLAQRRHPSALPVGLGL